MFVGSFFVSSFQVICATCGETKKLLSAFPNKNKHALVI